MTNFREAIIYGITVQAILGALNLIVHLTQNI